MLISNKARRIYRMSSWTNYKVRIFELYVAEDLRDSAVQWSEHSEQRNAITMIV